jgi:integrase
MRHLFGNGSGTTRDRRKSTKTKDFKIAKSREDRLTQIIYGEFDERIRQQEYNQDQLTDEFAIATITGLAHSFNYKKIPALKTDTTYDSLTLLRHSCDAYANLIFNEASEDQIFELLKLSSSSSDPLEILAETRRLCEQHKFTIRQKGLAGRHKSEIVHNFWEDLLIGAARKQGLTEPSAIPFKGEELKFSIIGGQILPNTQTLENIYGQPLSHVSRPTRVTPRKVLKIGSVIDGYLADMHLKQSNIGTQRKLARWIQQFLEIMGDLEIATIKPKHGYDYVRAILAEHPNRSNKTLKDYVWGVQNFFKYCLENGFIDINPFTGLDLSKYGKSSEETYAFSGEDLKMIFSYQWQPQDRLFLSILATTGMRPSEVGNLTWERFNDTEYNGIRFFTLFDTINEKVRVKNKSSKREVPIHPGLALPKQASGRLFDYRKDDEGLSSAAAGHVINPVIRKLVMHQNKSIRSFRRTFKTMLRDLSVGEEVHDAITGHTIPSASRKNYGGMGMQVKFDAIAKLDISFL